MKYQVDTDYIHDTIEALQGGISVSRAFEQALNEYHELFASKGLTIQESLENTLEELEEYFELDDNFYSLRLVNIEDPEYLLREISNAQGLVDEFQEAIAAFSAQSEK
ncbi:hypothetical protein [Pseudoalteromonas sp. G4]|uniref:hypothetical protein n=1 Tax=Pseudoalteromonas sp. G4 TaxID=2992761 RepID=UPI00237DDF4E|nr:hypothetical protein [Pseudoalteromonas sp. G4]MDE3273088.1 hypothetical protein [Pseudoalteromonas sp. G4]